MNRLIEFLQSRKTGKLSSNRLAFLLFVGVFLFVWGYSCYSSKTIVEIPEGVRWVFGLLIGGNVGHKWAENKTSTNVTTTVTG